MSKSTSEELEDLRKLREAERRRKEKDSIEAAKLEEEARINQQRKIAFQDRINTFKPKAAPTGEEIVNQSILQREYDREFQEALQKNPTMSPYSIELALKKKYHLNLQSGSGDMKASPSILHNIKSSIMLSTVKTGNNNSSQTVESFSPPTATTITATSAQCRLWEEMSGQDGQKVYRCFDTEEVITEKPLGGTTVVISANESGVEEEWQEYTSEDANDSTAFYVNLANQDIRDVKPQGFTVVVVMSPALADP